jgi:hypothetical protein
MGAPRKVAFNAAAFHRRTVVKTTLLVEFGEGKWALWLTWFPEIRQGEVHFRSTKLGFKTREFHNPADVIVLVDQVIEGSCLGSAQMSAVFVMVRAWLRGISPEHNCE